MDRKLRTKVAVVTGGSAGTNYRADNSYETDLTAFRIEAGEAKILFDPFLSDNPSRDDGWSGYLYRHLDTGR
jgi:hypothetical protein